MLCAMAASQALSQAIYTCVDAKGRRLTADRPIVDCLDREQKELNPSGTLRRKHAPSMTATERAAADEAARKVADEKNRAEDEKRRDRALITRYPRVALHDQERATALAKVDEVIASAGQRQKEVLAQRKDLEAQSMTHDRDPGRMPPQLRRLIEENDQQQAAQKRFVIDQLSEKARINARFDEERARLEPLWARRGGAPAAPPTAAVTAPAPPAAAASRPAPSTPAVKATSTSTR